MIDFIIKSTLSLALLYVVYILMLEREKMHQFNRFYLLFGLLFSLIIPFITFEIYVESRVAVANTVVQPMPFSNAIIAEQTDYLPVILWSIYLIVTVGLLTRFANNLIKIRRKINSNPSEKLQNATLILLNEKVLPHTFLNYIFINRNDYENRKIEEELYTHEQTHVRQKHTLDILFIEILKTIFWFNPILILYKKAIQLNHEFLADENVVQSYNNVPFYQNLLLEKASWNNTFYLASNLNYLVTKKRLIMMTKTTSNKMLILKKLALVPILTGMIYFFCVETVAQQKTTSNSQNAVATDPIKENDYFKNVRFKYYSDSYKDTDGTRRGTLVIDKLYEDLTDLDKEKFELSLFVPNPIQKKAPSEVEFKDFKNKEKYAIWIDEKYVSNTKLSDYKATDFAYFRGSSVLKNARTTKYPQPFQFSLYTNAYFDKNEMGKQKTKYSGNEIALWGLAEKVASKESLLEKEEVKKEDAANNKLYQEYLLEVEKIKEANTRDKITKEYKDYVHNAVEKKPQYPGGMGAFYEFVGKNFRMPDVKDLKGRIFIQFIIEKDGSLTEIKSIRDLGNGTGEEAIRVLKLSPNWIPGQQDGKPVRVLYSLPISIVGS
jgi:beta-lactamase regulating signal transducer with metallopeptidase domain